MSCREGQRPLFVAVRLFVAGRVFRDRMVGAMDAASESLGIYARSLYQFGWPISMRKFWESLIAGSPGR